jgi:hypothetical protein
LDEEKVGMAFSTTLASFETSTDERARARRTLRLQVSVASEGRSLDRVLAHNISETGLLIETQADLRVGERFAVDLPSGLRSAKVVWSSDRLFGCRFLEEATSGVVSAALLRAPPAQSSNSPWLERSPAVAAGETDFFQGFPAPATGLSLRARAWVILGLASLSWAAIASVVIVVT